MNNKILQADQISTVTPTWQHPILPGHATQGSLLYTISDFTNPPQSQEMFKWIPMEELVGIHDVSFRYYEQDNTYHIYKTYGHLNNDGSWTEDTYDIGHFNGISDAVREALENMKYVSYEFSFENNVYSIDGVLKDGTKQHILDMTIPTKAEFDTEVQERKDADKTINTTINNFRIQHIEDVTNLTTALNNEIATRKADDDNIKADITQKVEYAIQYALNVTSQLNQEVEVRKANDNELQKQITDETTSRTNADNRINQTIATQYQTLNSKIDSIAGAAVHTEVVETKPASPTNNTMYYVGKDGSYQVWLYSNDTWYDMGTTQIDLTPYQTKAQAKIEHDELEEKITTSQGDITTITTDVTNLQTGYTTLNNIVSQHTADIATNAANITTNKNNIATNTTNIANNKAAIDTLKTTVAQNKPVAGDLINVTTATTGSTIALQGTTEEWTFTLSDNTEVKRKIRYFS